MWHIQRQIRRGFTIVEILIVITIIGLLASIILVSYAGTQQRARVALWADSLNAWEQLLESHKQATGKYPSTEAGGTVWAVCLGASFPADSTFSVDRCVTGAFAFTRAGWFEDSLSDQVKPVPTTILPTLKTVDNANGSTGWVRGIVYYGPPSGTGAWMEYYIDAATNGGKCIRSDTVEYSNYQGGIIRCRRYL